jgi:5'-deoxynucleotidase YfbR-like HD superfamily hydrolase
VAAFTRDLASVGSTATPEALTRAAPALRASLADAEVLSERLSAERLDDSRLEAQRARAADALATVVAAMRQTTDAASGSRPTRFVQAVDDYSTAVAALRAVGQPG